MLRRRGCVLTQLLLSSPYATATSPLHRLIAAAAEDHLTRPPALARSSILSSPRRRRLLSGTTSPGISQDAGFAAQDYLVSTCGLTRAQALKASPKLAHLRSAANPDAVLAFLAGLGLSAADVAALVARDPKFLCAGVDKGLSPIVAGLSGLALEIRKPQAVGSANFKGLRHPGWGRPGRGIADGEEAAGKHGNPTTWNIDGQTFIGGSNMECTAFSRVLRQAKPVSWVPDPLGVDAGHWICQSGVCQLQRLETPGTADLDEAWLIEKGQLEELATQQPGTSSFKLFIGGWSMECTALLVCATA